MALASCIQGPWDYYPKDPPIYRGVYATGYALSGMPIRHVCFERVLDLSEEATQAFAFYDSADVRIDGTFSGMSRSLNLTAVADTPNCFTGDSLALVERGGDYALTARFVWDSAGTRAVSVLKATAQVPDSFDLRDSARAPTIASTGGIPDNIFDPAFVQSLPPDVKSALTEEFPEALPLITAVQADPADSAAGAALKAYIAIHGVEITARVKDLLGGEYFTYPEGATLYYLNGILNTLSHYFSAERSDDVKAVLITQRFEPNSARPETRFDSPFGFKPDSSQYYFPGSTRRLIVYPDAKGANGYNLLDSMGVVNLWFHTLRNRLYFYGMEQAYYDYTSTAIDGASDARIKPKYNVEGGRGIFAGGVPDSFDIFIETDTLTKIYPLEITHGQFCHEDGWQDSKDCREYLREYCSARNWSPQDCRVDAVTACLEADMDGNDSLKARCEPVADTVRADAEAARRAEDRFCIERNFPDSEPVCAGATERCLETSGSNECKRALWDYCLDRSWRPQDKQCGPALASYCHDRPRLSETLCVHADAYCDAHKGSVLCK